MVPINKSFNGNTLQSVQYKRTELSGSTTLLATINWYNAVDEMITNGYRIPGFSRLLKRKPKVLVPHTPFVQYSRSGAGTQTYDVTEPGGQRTKADPYVFGILPEHVGMSFTQMTSIMDGSTVDYGAIVQQAAANVDTSFDALTFLAELKSVIRMFMSVGEKLIRLMRLKPAGTPWDLWLEGRYGWRTLIKDLEGLDRALRHVRSASEFVTGKAGFKTGEVLINSVNASEAGWVASITTVDTIQYSFRATVAAQLNVPNISFNPLVTAWELLRFSFVIDWFFSVGNALKALSVIALSKQMVCSYGWEMKCSRETTLEVHSVTAGYAHNRTLNASGQSILVRRVPSTVSVIPRFRLNLDVSKIADLLALLAQAIIRR